MSARRAASMRGKVNRSHASVRVVLDVDSLNAEQQADVQRCLTALQWAVADSLQDPGATHMISTDPRSSLYQQAVAGSLPVVLPSWAAACCTEGRALPAKSHLLRPLHDVDVCMSNFPSAEKARLAALAEGLGARVHGALTVTEQMVLVTDKLQGLKVQFARKAGIPVAPAAWLQHCADTNCFHDPREDEWQRQEGACQVENHANGNSSHAPLSLPQQQQLKSSSPRFLEGYRIALCAMTEGEAARAAQACREGGAFRANRLSSTVTHAVFGSRGEEQAQMEMEGIRRRHPGALMLTQEWLWRCQEQRRYLEPVSSELKVQRKSGTARPPPLEIPGNGKVPWGDSVSTPSLTSPPVFSSSRSGASSGGKKAGAAGTPRPTTPFSPVSILTSAGSLHMSLVDGGQQQVFEGVTVLLSDTLGAQELQALAGMVEQHGGRVMRQDALRRVCATQNLPRKKLPSHVLMRHGTAESEDDLQRLVEECFVGYSGPRIEVTVCSKDWLQDCVTERKLLKPSRSLVYTPVLRPSAHNQQLFEACCVCTTGMHGPPKEHVQTVCKVLGMRFEENLSRSVVTHLLCTDSTSRKYREAKRWGDIHVLFPDWCMASAKQGQPCDPDPFLFREVRAGRRGARPLPPLTIRDKYFVGGERNAVDATSRTGASTPTPISTRTSTPTSTSSGVVLPKYDLRGMESELQGSQGSGTGSLSGRQSTTSITRGEKEKEADTQHTDEEEAGQDIQLDFSKVTRRTREESVVVMDPVQQQQQQQQDQDVHRLIMDLRSAGAATSNNKGRLLQGDISPSTSSAHLSSEGGAPLSSVEGSQPSSGKPRFMPAVSRRRRARRDVQDPDRKRLASDMGEGSQIEYGSGSQTDQLFALEQPPSKRPKEGVPPLRVFQISALDAREKERRAGQLESFPNVEYLTDPALNDRTTHLIVGKPTATEKYLSALARGLWILNTKFLDVAMCTGSFPAEAEYEICEKDISLRHADYDQLVGLARAARLRRQDAQRPFAGWRVMLACDSQKSKQLANVIRYGGGEVVETPCQGMACTFVNESSLMNLDMGHLARLTALKVPLVHDSFISKYLEDTSLDLLDHVFDPTSQGGNRRAVH